jgi:hypothetical protein
VARGTPLSLLLTALPVGAALVAAHPTAHSSLVPYAVSLDSPWKFTLGDSPINPKTGLPLWAEPDFDDSTWQIAANGSYPLPAFNSGGVVWLHIRLPITPGICPPRRVGDPVVE